MPDTQNINKMTSFEKQIKEIDVKGSCNLSINSSATKINSLQCNSKSVNDSRSQFNINLKNGQFD